MGPQNECLPFGSPHPALKSFTVALRVKNRQKLDIYKVKSLVNYYKPKNNTAIWGCQNDQGAQQDVCFPFGIPLQKRPSIISVEKRHTHLGVSMFDDTRFGGYERKPKRKPPICVLVDSFHPSTPPIFSGAWPMFLKRRIPEEKGRYGENLGGVPYIKTCPFGVGSK